MEGRETTMERRQGVNGGRPEGGADRRNDVQLSEYSRMLDAARSTRAGGKTNKLKQEGRGRQTQRFDPDGRVAAIAADLEASCRAASKDPRTGAKRMKIVSTTTSSTGDDDQDQIMLSEPVDLVINWFPRAPQSSVQSSSVNQVGSAARADDEKDSTKAGDEAGEEHLQQSGENPIASFLEHEELQTKNKFEKKMELAVEIENNSEILYLLRSAEKHGLFEKVNGMNLRNVWVAINGDALKRFGAPRHFEYGVEKLDGSGRKHQINLVTEEDVVPEAEQGLWNDPNVLGDLPRTDAGGFELPKGPLARRSLRTQWIHHIPGLSRYFIIMPDDSLFVAGSVSGAVFFSKDAGGSVPGQEAGEEEKPLHRREDDGHQQHHVAEGGGSLTTSYFATPLMYRYGSATDGACLGGVSFAAGHGPVLIDSCVYSRLADAKMFVPQVNFESLCIYQNTMTNVLGAKAVPSGGKGPGQQRTFYQECHTNDIWWHPCRHPPHDLPFVMNIQGNGISDEYPKDRTIQAEWQSWYHREFAAKSMFEHGGGRGDEAEFPALVLAQSRVEPTSASSSPTAATAPGLSKGAVSSVRVQHQSRSD
eukprot:CAMPEP_0178990202 /NCGR_PEP_ID=MMETSP0795-20121207/4800_1 /TAXON_ID=88552 /ORGANISM="Amoebophrya sp., Strain Ameob2" /LENGTH=589 /DNA_ID=CAMNT_0020681691 /DNA_START=123 /DNA_END=1892 /DNA_ORIENTATION=-